MWFCCHMAIVWLDMWKVVFWLICDAVLWWYEILWLGGWLVLLQLMSCHIVMWFRWGQALWSVDFCVVLLFADIIVGGLSAWTVLLMWLDLLLHRVICWLICHVALWYADMNYLSWNDLSCWYAIICKCDGTWNSSTSPVGVSGN
jgi:hypothetical protein